MERYPIILACLIVLAAAAPTRVSGQMGPDHEALMSAQREAMKQFEVMDGLWRGNAWIMLPSGEKHQMTQTERVGSFLDGGVKVIEGLGYEPDGSVGFNALGIISYDPASQQYTLRTYARGQVGDFVVTPVEGGLQWEIPAGPMTIRYTARIGDGTWHEIGERIAPGGDVIRFSELNLERVARTDWPSAGQVPKN